MPAAPVAALAAAAGADDFKPSMRRAAVSATSAAAVTFRTAACCCAERGSGASCRLIVTSIASISASESRRASVSGLTGSRRAPWQPAWMKREADGRAVRHRTQTAATNPGYAVTSLTGLRACTCSETRANVSNAASSAAASGEALGRPLRGTWRLPAKGCSRQRARTSQQERCAAAPESSMRTPRRGRLAPSRP